MAELPRLWIDLGPLFRHQGNVAGIQRVATCVIEQWLSQPGLPLRFCGYDAAQATYREIDRQAVLQLLADFTANRPGGAFPAWLQPSPGNRPGKANLWLRGAQHLRKSLGRRLGRFRGSLSSRARAPFTRGDVLFLPVNSWNDAGIAQALTDASTRCGALLVPMLYDVIPLRQPHLVHRGKTAV
jgi:hypothetical protein